MSTARYKASDFSSEAQRFLFACVYWLTAADETITGEEQNWLITQFGQENVDRLLKEFIELDSAGFYVALDGGAAALADDEKLRIYTGLEEWLTDCAISDGNAAKGKEEVWEALRARVRLDAEVARLRTAPDAGDPPPLPLSNDSADDAADIAPAEPFDYEVPESYATADETPPSDNFVVLEGHTDELTGVAFSPDGTQLASVSQDMTLRIWHAATGAEVRSLNPTDAPLTAVAFGAQRLFCADRMGRVLAMDLGGESAWNIKLGRCGGITSLALSPDEQTLATTTETGRVILLSTGDGSVQREFGKRFSGIAHAVAWHPEGGQVLVGGDDRTARIWDTQTGECRRELSGHGDGVTGVAWHPSGKQIATSARNNVVHLWHATTGDAQQQLAGHDFIASGVCFGPDGFVVSISWDHTLKIWDAATGTVKTNIENIDGRFNAVVYHAAAACIAAGCSDNSIYLVRD